eukprot:TRINITY_DN11721_c0_g2_i2.p1 TRINITY_DN11721_c0_g2~~TRINITY_DN11721_c0_g2_i2.p1  ORF type:complete len:249 (+),score=32.21 TRINITY_DN11721_c0_g2_i2:177-923(+)
MADNRNRGIGLIKRAVAFHQANKLQEAIDAYTNGSQLLVKYLQTCPPAEKPALYTKINEYISTAEELKARMRRETKGATMERRAIRSIQINDGEAGYDYEVIFYQCIRTATEVRLEDPFIAAMHQLHNYVRFCELLVRVATNLKTIKLDTRVAEARWKDVQNQCFQELKASLQARGVAHHVRYDDSLHDRQVVCDNGHVVALGRGLDLYQPPPRDTRFFVGMHDYGLRACKPCRIDIMYDPAHDKLHG